MRKLIGVDLLVIDDFALQPLDMPETADVYEFFVERHRAKATVMTSNRDPSEWLATMADPLLAQSAVDRLKSAAWELVIEGESYRQHEKPTLKTDPSGPPDQPVSAHVLDTDGPLRDHRHSRSKRTRRGPMLLAKRWSHRTGKRHVRSEELDRIATPQWTLDIDRRRLAEPCVYPIVVRECGLDDLLLDLSVEQDGDLVQSPSCRT